MQSKENNLSFRQVREEDIPIICNFPQTTEELFFMFPKATFPLTEDQLQKSIESRFDAHVVLYENEVAAFASFYERADDAYCYIGNIVVNPSKRGLGIGRYLLNQMNELAIQKYNIKELRLVCFNTNTNALLFYTKYGFIPYELKPRVNYNGDNIVSIYMKYTGR